MLTFYKLKKKSKRKEQVKKNIKAKGFLRKALQTFPALRGWYLIWHPQALNDYTLTTNLIADEQPAEEEKKFVPAEELRIPSDVEVVSHDRLLTK